jgi:hypothetical protein
MTRLDLSPQFYAIADHSGLASGVVYHVERIRGGGGSLSTPVAQFFVSTPPLVAEGFHPHQRLDCFVRKHELAPRGDWLTKRLADLLIEQGVIHQPIWLGWHEATEIGGEALGEVFDFD